MSNSYANKQAKYSRYVVKNLSNKEVRIFGINIKPGKEFDLLSIPGISQNEIFSSVLKDDIGPRLRSTPAILSVVENTIDLITITLPDADYTLDPVYFDFGTIIFAGTLTAQRNIIFPNYGSTDNNWIIRNNTNQFLNVKTSAGIGKLIQSGLSEIVFSDGINILKTSGIPLLSGVAGNVLTENLDSTLSFSATTTVDSNLTGGFRSVADITARNSITAPQRKEGMYVYIQSTNDLYKLGSGLTNSDWIFAKDNSSVSNLTTLAALNDAECTDRVEFRVLTLDEFFYLDKTSTVTADAISIINSLSSASGVNPGRWIRRPSFSRKFFTQRTWYVNPTTGNDESQGDTSPNALKTVKEFNRRIWGHPGGGGFLVNILGNLPTTDPPKFTGDFTPDAIQTVLPQDQPFNSAFIFGTNQAVIFKGSYTTVLSKTVTSATTASSSTNTKWTLTDSTVSSWTTYETGNYAIRFTSGVLNGMFAIPLKDIGGNAVFISHPASTLNDVSGTFTVLTAAVAPSPGDTYEIISFQDCDGFDAIHNVVKPTLTVLQFFNFTGSGLSAPKIFQNSIYSDYQHCVFQGALQIIRKGYANLRCCKMMKVTKAIANVNIANQISVFLTDGVLNISYSGLTGMYYQGTNHTNKCFVQDASTVDVFYMDINSGVFELYQQITSLGTGSVSSQVLFYIFDMSIFLTRTVGDIIGTGYAGLFFCKMSGKAIIRQFTLSNGNYSFVSSAAIVIFGVGFAYAYPPFQSIAAAATPTLQPFTLITATTLLALNTTPWSIPPAGVTGQEFAMWGPSMQGGLFAHAV